MDRASLRGLTILVVDDDADARAVLRQMVKWFGATVHAARDGFEALEWLATHKADLILLDLRMPGLDGLTVLAHLRAQPEFRSRAIAVTALGSDADMLRTWEAGFDGHLVKPVDLETLMAALKRACWAHSGKIRFAVSQASTRATGRSRTRVLKPRVPDVERHHRHPTRKRRRAS